MNDKQPSMNEHQQYPRLVIKSNNAATNDPCERPGYQDSVRKHSEINRQTPCAHLSGGHGRASCSLTTISEQAVVLLPEDLIALARDRFYPAPVDDPRIASALLDEPFNLQLAGDVGHARAPHPQHVRGKFLR